MRTLLRNATMQSASRYFRIVSLVLGAVMMLAAPGRGQMPGSSNPRTPMSQRIPEMRSLDDPRYHDPASAIFAERRLQALNAAQHQAIVDDTDKLVKLVTELNKQISSSNAHSLTPQQRQMVEEIEKLAHSVRDKMRMTLRTVEIRDIMPMPPYSPR
jgi:hypothetical protein